MRVFDIYTFNIAGIYNYSGAVCVFMDIDDLNRVFDLGDGFFCGYLSDTEITDQPSEEIPSAVRRH